MQSGFPMPRLLDVDSVQERILKEYIEGPTIYDMVLNYRMEPSYLTQLQDMCDKLYPAGLNIDYFPTNFIVKDEQLYYIDYECNDYMEQWNFENWGVKYWSRTPEFLEYAKAHQNEG